MTDTKKMMKQLQTGLKELKKAQGIQEKLTNDLISNLPEDIRKEAIILLNKAKKGKANISEVMDFAKKNSKGNNADLNDAAERARKKEEDLKDNSDG